MLGWSILGGIIVVWISALLVVEIMKNINSSLIKQVEQQKKEIERLENHGGSKKRDDQIIKEMTRTIEHFSKIEERECASEGTFSHKYSQLKETVAKLKEENHTLKNDVEYWKGRAIRTPHKE